MGDALLTTPHTQKKYRGLKVAHALHMGKQLQQVGTEADEEIPGLIGVRLMLVGAAKPSGEQWERENEKGGQLPQ